MQIQVSAGGIDGREELPAHVETEVRAALGWFGRRITRVDRAPARRERTTRGVHDDKRCVMEARLRHRQPVAVTHQAASESYAVGGAADKLKNLIERIVGRLRRR